MRASMALLSHMIVASVILLCVLAPSLCQEEELAAFEAVAESPAPPAEVLCPVKVQEDIILISPVMLPAHGNCRQTSAFLCKIYDS